MNFLESLSDKCDDIRKQHLMVESQRYKHIECQNSRGIHILGLCLTSIPYAIEAHVEAGIGNSDHNLITVKISVDTPPNI